MRKILNKKGFTLIELLIVIAIIAIIAAVVFVALDPLSRFQDSRNSRRWSDVNAIMSAAKINQVDNKGYYLTEIQGLAADEVYMIGTADLGCDDANLICDTDVTSDTHCANLTELVNQGYLGTIPISPNGDGTWTAGVTGYTITLGANGLLTIRACEAEGTTDEIWIAR